MNQVQDLLDSEDGFRKFIFSCNEFYEDYDLNEGEDPALKTEEQLRNAVKSLFKEF